VKSLLYPSKVFTPLACLIFLLFICSGIGADNYVFIDSGGFEPSSLQIQTGDTVYWLNLDDGITHSSVSDQNLWNSGAMQPYDQYPASFPHTGTFTYHDGYSSFTGSITVNPAPPPSPTLLKPLRSTTGVFQFTVTNLVLGKTNFIQASSDLVNWTNIYTNIASATGYTYTNNSAPAFKIRFYRAWVLP
jgi:hypothetical protein